MIIIFMLISNRQNDINLKKITINLDMELLHLTVELFQFRHVIFTFYKWDFYIVKWNNSIYGVGFLRLTCGIFPPRKWNFCILYLFINISY